MARWLPEEDYRLYQPVSRSLRIEGYSTSVRLERMFWDVLDQMAGECGLSTGGLLADIHRELSQHTPLHNFASVLRVICLRRLGLNGQAFPPRAQPAGPARLRPPPGLPA
jgi:predicted DNA-binding ribbon-helix-helix protein